MRTDTVIFNVGDVVKYFVNDYFAYGIITSTFVIDNMVMIRATDNTSTVRYAKDIEKMSKEFAMLWRLEN